MGSRSWQWSAWRLTAALFRDELVDDGDGNGGSEFGAGDGVMAELDMEQKLQACRR